jgi:hypothetical protein
MYETYCHGIHCALLHTDETGIYVLSSGYPIWEVQSVEDAVINFAFLSVYLSTVSYSLFMLENWRWKLARGIGNGLGPKDWLIVRLVISDW